jgi:hypothetical protein
VDRLEKDSDEDVRRISGINEAALGEIETVQSGSRSSVFRIAPFGYRQQSVSGYSTTTPLYGLHRWLRINPKQNFGKLQQVERPSAAHICDSTISLIAGRPGEPCQTEFGQDMIGVIPCGR